MTHEPGSAAIANTAASNPPADRIHRPASAVPGQPSSATQNARAQSGPDPRPGQADQPAADQPAADQRATDQRAADPRAAYPPAADHPGVSGSADHQPGRPDTGGSGSAEPEPGRTAPGGPDPDGREPASGGSAPGDRASGPGSGDPAAGGSGSGDPAAGGSAAVPGAGVLAVLALLWLGAMLWSAQAAISSSELVEMAVTSAAYALPGAISAGLVGGAALALTVVNTLGGRLVRGERLAGDPTRRFIMATLAGLAVGVLGAVVVLVSYGSGDTVSVLAGTIAAAGTIGGAVAGMRAARVLAAVVAAGLTVFAIGFVLNLFQVPLLSLFGSGDTQASQASAVGWFALTASVTGGLGAGLVAYGYLRVTGRRAASGPTRWTWYGAAGAGPGLLLLIAELLAHTAGARVLALAGAVSEADRVAQSLLSGSRVNNALIVLFVGAVTAIIAVGRSIRPATDPAEPGSAPAEVA